MRSVSRLMAMTVVALLAICFSTTTFAKDVFSTTPRTNNGKKWRIGYFEGGFESNYYNYLQATVRGLMELGWVEQAALPPVTTKKTQPLWQWLVKEAKSDYLEFAADAYYTANWDESNREKIRGEIIKRLNKPGEIDLMIAMGSWAGKDLACDEHSVPTIIMSTSDPVKSQIIKSVDDSGRDHVHARVDPLRYERQVRIFHDIIHFKRLGVAYEDSVYGRTYAAMDLIEKVARERGFDVVSCYTQSDIADLDLAGESVTNCFKELVRKVDAIYVTMQGGVNAKSLPELVKIANEHRIPTFYQAGAEGVKEGLLMSISRAGFKPVGMFEAAIIAKIFNGAKPRQLGQLFEEAPNIAINLKTAEVIGLYLYADVLAAADEIYREIGVGE